MEWLNLVHGKAKRQEHATFKGGDDVRVWFSIREQGKERVAQFEGVVLRVRGSWPSRTFTVRRLTHGVGVERVFPLDSPMLKKVEVLRRGKAKRSRLYFLRHVVKSTRLKSAEMQGETGDSASPASPASAAGDAETPGTPEAVAAADKPAEPAKPAA